MRYDSSQKMTPDAESQVPAPANPPQRVMPYRAGPDLDETPPRDLVYGKMGQFALILAVTAASFVLAAIIMGRSIAVYSGCFGVVAWLMSLTIATRVSLSESIGRKWAIAAILLDVCLMFGVVYLVR